jgi:hypothetical protein
MPRANYFLTLLSRFKVVKALRKKNFHQRYKLKLKIHLSFLFRKLVNTFLFTKSAPCRW